MGYLHVTEVSASELELKRKQFTQCLYLLPDDKDIWSKNKVFGDQNFIDAFFYASATLNTFHMYQSVQDFRFLANAMINDVGIKDKSKSDNSDLIKALFKLFRADSEVGTLMESAQVYIKGVDLTVAKFLPKNRSILAFHFACIGYSVFCRYPSIDLSKMATDLTKVISEKFYSSYYFIDFFNGGKKLEQSTIEWFEAELNAAITKVNCVLFSKHMNLFNADFSAQIIMNDSKFIETYKKLIAGAFVNSTNDVTKFKAYIVASLCDTMKEDEAAAVRDLLAKLPAPIVAEEKTKDELPTASSGASVTRERVQYGSFLYKLDKYDEAADVELFYLPIIRNNLEKIDKLFIDFPNFSEPLAFIRRHVLINLIAGGPFSFPPICLKGPGGTGKSEFGQALKAALDATTINIHASQITCGSILSGLQRTWGNAQPGMITEKMGETQIVNPLVIFEELSALTTPYGNGSDPMVALQRMLDVNEAKRFIDGFTLNKVDLSKISWVFSANHINNLTEWFKQRVQFFNIEPIPESDYPKVLNKLYRDSIDELNLGAVISSELNDMSRQMLLKKMRKGTDFRRFKSLIKDSISAYCDKNFETIVARPAGEKLHVELEFLR